MTNSRPTIGFFRRCLFPLVLLILVLLRAPAYPQDIATPFIVVERKTGHVLLQNQPFDGWYPASLTKLMTFYVALRAVANGELEDGSPVVISRNASRQPPSKMGYPVDTKLRLDTALQILVVKSANDVAVAVAESVAGSQKAFVARMNEEAKRLGMNGSRFANPHGLHSAEQYVTARDMALLARQILIEFPQYADYFAAPAIRSGDKTDYSYNLLLERFGGADGMKTGFVCASGYNMVASATREGRQLIAVLFGTESQTDRAVEAAKLLLQGFETVGNLPLERLRAFDIPAQPRSQREVMCSEAARNARYDPGAGNAKIDSPLLQKRQTVREPTVIATGGIDAPPSEALMTARLIPSGTPPIPTPRPEYVRKDVDDQPVTEIAPIRNGIPIPTPRPAHEAQQG